MIIELDLDRNDFNIREFSFCNIKGSREFFLLCKFEFDVINYIYVKLAKSPHTLEGEDSLLKVIRALDVTNRVDNDTTPDQFLAASKQLDAMGELISAFCELTAHKYYNHLIRLQGFMHAKKSIIKESLETILENLNKKADSPTVH